jgi:hypothetical protein
VLLVQGHLSCVRRLVMGRHKIPAQNRCFICGSLSKVQTHHLDWHHDNPDPHNRVKLCQTCHSIIHSSGYSTMDDMRAIRGKVIAIRKAKGEVEEEILRYYPKKLL